jgi:hypothetical protein
MMKVVIKKLYKSQRQAEWKIRKISKCGRGHGHKSKKISNSEKKFYPLIEKAIEARNNLCLQHGKDLYLYPSIIQVRYTNKNGKLKNISVSGYFLTSSRKRDRL